MGDGDHKYKLIYLNARGRAEVARYLFALGRCTFEDCRVDMAQWPAVKPTTPYGQVPVLEIDGAPYCQSEAIYRYLARQFGLYGKTLEDGLLIDQMLGCISDFFRDVLRINSMQGEEQEAAKAKFTAEAVPKITKFVEAQLGGKQWLVGGSVSLADTLVFELFSAPVTEPYVGGWQQHSAAVTQLVERFAALPAIAEYVAGRPAASF